MNNELNAELTATSPTPSPDDALGRCAHLNRWLTSQWTRNPVSNNGRNHASNEKTPIPHPPIRPILCQIMTDLQGFPNSGSFGYGFEHGLQRIIVGNILEAADQIPTRQLSRMDSFAGQKAARPSFPKYRARTRPSRLLESLPHRCSPRHRRSHLCR